MGSVVGPIVLGALIVVLGFLNMKGNIASVHWYHRTRVTEENRLQFGRLIGLGTILVGASIVAFGCFALIFEMTHREVFIAIGSAIAIIGIAAGLAVSVYAMFKYNKGIF